MYFTLITVTLISATFLLFWACWPKQVEKVSGGINALSFRQLPGWQTSNVKQSLLAFQKSCSVFLKTDPEHRTGSQHIDMKVKDWQPACLAALSLSDTSNARAKNFFENWFMPVKFYKHKPLKGMFTGYFVPSIPGSMVKTPKYSVPIYGLPSNLITSHVEKFKHRHAYIMRYAGKKLVPFYTRKEINQGAIAHTANVIAWVTSDIDRLFIEIEGSGTIELPDKKLLHISYAGENGAHYTSIAQIMIKKGIVNKDNASYKHIKRYLDAHPAQAKTLLNQNKSFVFFQELKDHSALGAQGIPLTKGYSLAVDREWIPLGAPLWLSTTKPNQTHEKLQRLMVAQDTGGAIRGMVRGDIFYGSGKAAIDAAANMQNIGRYWLLLPKHIAIRIKNTFSYA